MIQLQYRIEKKIGIKQEANEKRNKNKKDKNLIHTFLFILSN